MAVRAAKRLQSREIDRVEKRIDREDCEGASNRDYGDLEAATRGHSISGELQDYCSRAEAVSAANANADAAHAVPAAEIHWSWPCGNPLSK